MRIKVLIGAAAIAAGALTAVAQSNVYSLNVVGYINLSMQEGFNLVANQLDADGTGVNNFVYQVFGSQLPNGSQVWLYNSGSWNECVFKNKLGQTTPVWSAAGTNSTLNPGEGAFVYIPVGSGAQTITTVGQVLQGQLNNTNIPSAGGFALVSAMFPLSGGLTSVLGYNPPAAAQETFYTFSGGVSGTYSTYTWGKKLGQTTYSWKSGEPVINVGQGFWGDYNPGSTWNTNFTVQ